MKQPEQAPKEPEHARADNVPAPEPTREAEQEVPPWHKYLDQARELNRAQEQEREIDRER